MTPAEAAGVLGVLREVANEELGARREYDRNQRLNGHGHGLIDTLMLTAGELQQQVEAYDLAIHALGGDAP